MVRRVVARLVPAQENRGELVEGELAVRRRVTAGSTGADQLLLRVGFRARVAGREPAAARGHRSRQRPTEPEAAAEGLAHVPDLLEVAPDEALLDRLIVGGERAAAADGLPALEHRERRLGGERARFDRVVDPLQRRHVDEAGSVAREQQARRVQPLRQRQESPFGDRLRAPGDPLAAVEQLADERVRLQLLQQVVDGKLDVAVVEPHHHAERQQLVAHRIDERAAELAILGAGAQRPAHRVDDSSKWPGDTPDLLDAERPDLRVLACEAERLDRGARQVALRSFREHGNARKDIRAGLEVRQLLAVSAAALVAGADAAHPAVLDEQLRRGGLGQDHRPGLLRLRGQPATELRQRGDAVAVVLHRRRRRDSGGAVAGQEVDRLLLDHAVEGELVEPLAAREEPLQRARVDDRAREQVRARLLTLLDHRDRHVAEAFGNRRCLLEQLAEPDCAGEPGWAGADDRDADLDALVLRIGRPGDRLRDVERRREVGRLHRPNPPTGSRAMSADRVPGPVP